MVAPETQRQLPCRAGTLLIARLRAGLLAAASAPTTQPMQAARAPARILLGLTQTQLAELLAVVMVRLSRGTLWPLSVWRPAERAGAAMRLVQAARAVTACTGLVAGVVVRPLTDLRQARAATAAMDL
jgi:hypothetical protein